MAMLQCTDECCNYVCVEGVSNEFNRYDTHVVCLVS